MTAHKGKYRWLRNTSTPEPVSTVPKDRRESDDEYRGRIWTLIGVTARMTGKYKGHDIVDAKGRKLDKIGEYYGIPRCSR